MAAAHFARMETFARNLRRLADELGVSNAEIARRLGVSERRYAHYARGDREPDLAMVVRMAALFQTSTDELLGVAEPLQLSEREKLQARLAAATNCLNDRDLALFVAMAEAAAAFSRAGKSSSD
ncbi:helix-turn-helix domain-containing protein [uncultured Bosea sp.]|uniref:helix-turn-helix domain-containing protein n=1 Tax=uncultured Bosea sp. TaxID=211457 RepID=UPI00345BC69F